MVDHCIKLRALSGSLSAERENICKRSGKSERIFWHKGFKTIISIAPSYAGVLDFDQPGQVVDAHF